jgi:hypothetical protein
MHYEDKMKSILLLHLAYIQLLLGSQILDVHGL